MADQKIDDTRVTTYGDFGQTSKEFESRQVNSWISLDNDSSEINGKIGLDRLNPSSFSKTDILFNLDQESLDFSLIQEPFGYSNQSGRLFTRELSKALNPIDTLLDRVDDITNANLDKLKKKSPSKENQEKIDAIQNESNALKLAFLQAKKMKEDIELVAGNRAGFQKV